MQNRGVTCIVCGMLGPGLAAEKGGVWAVDMVGEEACGKDENEVCVDCWVIN